MCTFSGSCQRSLMWVHQNTSMVWLCNSVLMLGSGGRLFSFSTLVLHDRHHLHWLISHSDTACQRYCALLCGILFFSCTGLQPMLLVSCSSMNCNQAHATCERACFPTTPYCLGSLVEGKEWTALSPFALNEFCSCRAVRRV